MVAARLAAFGETHGDAFGIALRVGGIADRVDGAVERSSATLDRALQHASSRPRGGAQVPLFLEKRFRKFVVRTFDRVRDAVVRAPDPTLLALALFQRRDDAEMIDGLGRVALRGSEYTLVCMLRALGYNVPSYSYTPTGNRVMLVSGLGSSSASASEFDTAVDALGYRADQRMHFSYDPEALTYSAGATYGDIETAACAFDTQMRQAKIDDPSSSVDIIGHSEGGFVAMYWLQRYYDPADPGYPRVANLLTLGSPLRGVPAADLDAVGNSCPNVEAEIRESLGHHLPPDGARSVEQMRSGSDAVRFLADHPVPDSVHVESIAAPFDYVVPANRAALPGQTARMVSPQSWNQHHALLDDPAAIRAMQRALNHQPEPPQAAVEEFTNVMGPYVIGTAETGAAIGLRATACR